MQYRGHRARGKSRQCSVRWQRAVFLDGSKRTMLLGQSMGLVLFDVEHRVSEVQEGELFTRYLEHEPLD